MKRLAAFAALVLATIELSAIGCNAILGNKDGILNEEASTPATCGAEEKMCGTCVLLTDPSVGCGGPCSACTSPTNAQSKCILENDQQTCGLGDCNPQFGNCDNDPSNGCETHTTTKENCGECGKTCAPDPFCEPDTDGGPGYFCSQTCDAPNQTCPSDGGLECVDPKTDGLNCGACGVSCSVSNGNGFCDAGNCDIQCDPGDFKCGTNGACTPQTNRACGQDCTNCTSRGETCDLDSLSATYGTCVGGNTGGDSGVPVTCKNGGCGASCEICGVGSSCDGTTGACICSNGSTLCVSQTVPATAWCCASSETCGAIVGQCDTAPPTCTAPACLVVEGDFCGCHIASGCQTPTRIACGPTCSQCATNACCCPNTIVSSDDGGGTKNYMCVTNPDGGTACPPGCQ